VFIALKEAGFIIRELANTIAVFEIEKAIEALL